MNHNKKNKTVAIISILALSLTGCSTVQTVFKNQQINIPVATFSCEEPIARPSGDPIMESQVAKYIASLEKTVPDCKMRLEEIQQIIICYNDRKCDVPSLMKGLAIADRHPSG